jgi:tetratricopeptide (TPR) repeat protein
LSGPHPDAFSIPKPELMQQLASQTGGSSYSLSNLPGDQVEKEIVRNAQDILTRGKPAPDYRPLPFVWAALILLLLYQILPAIPLFKKIARFKHAGIAALLVLNLFAMAAPDPRVKRFEQALKDSAAGRHQEAIQTLMRLKQEGASEEADVAIGNIYYAQNKFDQAIESYKAAIQRNPANNRARWNWEVALKRKQNPTQQQDQPPPPPQQSPQMPEETAALLNYFDQQEAELMKQRNSKNKPPEFAW